MEEQAVIIQFGYVADRLEPLYDLERQLEAAVASAGVGELDGNDVAPDLSCGSLYLYGPDADALFAVIRPLVAIAGCLRSARATLRYGPPEDGVRERVMLIIAEPGATPDPAI